MERYARLGAVLLLAGGLSFGCGRATTEPALPPSQGITLAPADGQTATGSGNLVNMGSVIEVDLTGKGFQPTGAYSIYVMNQMTRVRTGVGPYPYQLPVNADGSINYQGTFDVRGVRNPLLLIYYHADGNVQNLSNAQLMFTGAFPERLY